MMLKTLAVAAAFALYARPVPPARSMVVTVDDLPYVSLGAGPYVSSAQRATEAILRVLRAHHVPATGFVNERALANSNETAERTAILRRWVDAGMILGNHTYSHPDFNRRSVAEFEQEIARGDVVTRRLMASRGPYQLYFRHPMTHTGDTREKKEAIERFLADRGYKVAPHTIENSDYIFNAAYVRAVETKDDTTAAHLRSEYLRHTLAATEFAEGMSARIFGSEIPQTLLIHANDLNAECLDDMLVALEARGYRFVPLDDAMHTAAYQTKDTWVGTQGPTWLWRWMKSKGLNLSFAQDPEVPAWLVTLFDRTQRGT